MFAGGAAAWRGSPIRTSVALRSVLPWRGRWRWDDAAREVVGLAEPVLPATVVAAHLSACAAELPSGLPLAELPETVAHLVAGQRHIATALAGLATRLATGPMSADRAALVEVLRAAAAASGHAADALDAGEQLFENVANEKRF